MDRIDPFTLETTIATITSTGMIVVIAKVNVEVWSWESWVGVGLAPSGARCPLRATGPSTELGECAMTDGLAPNRFRLARLCRKVLWGCVLCLVVPMPAWAQSPKPADSPGGHNSTILIRPWNHDPSDPWAYVARRGQTDPGGTALGPVWNRPMFGATPARTELRPMVVPSSPGQTPPSHGPGPTIEIVGYSVLGIPLSLYRFGRSGPLTLIFGGIHGNERNSADLARRLAEHLMTHPDAYSERRVVLLPVANPDGTVKDSRTNSRGVDLNRNFPAKNWAAGKEGPQFGGKSPLSEPESTALAKLVEDAAPARIIAIHAIFGGRECNNYDGPAEGLATLMGTLNRYPVKKSIGYPTPGSFGTWAGVERQIPVITLELPQGMPGEACWNVQREALLGVIRAP